MKVTLLTATNSRKSGGLFYSVKYLAKYLKHIGLDVSITSFSDELSNVDLQSYDDIQMEIYNISKIPILSKMGFSSDLYRILLDLSPDIIHQQGIWLFHSYASLKYKNRCRTINIITPRGMLDPWLKVNSPFKKFFISILYENSNLRNADCIHALCESEMSSIRHLGLLNPIAVIPNGIEIPNWTRYSKKDNHIRTLLYLGRLDKKKGVDIFLKSLFNLSLNSPFLFNSWRIVIGGWGDIAYTNELIDFVNIHSLNSIVQFVGPVYGNEKTELLKSVDAFILPSHSEGLPMAILEAWAYELPVLMTKFCNLPEGFNYKAAFYIDILQSNMESQLRDFFELTSTDLEIMGKNGRKLVEDKFSWSTISSKVLELYKWLYLDTVKPDFVFLK